MGEPLRPTRPSDARAAAAATARQFLGEGEEVPLKIMVTTQTRAAFRRAAAEQGVSMRRMILGWAREAGVAVDPADEGTDANG
ncbi:hypothetical protein WME90_01765 [Sorangium sp. So ce375]|uniref:hypothetical protein n=1 Tax=Sorangium sp. So ce375 TaxID=3133306 RepID=UPI003F5BA68B